jgi:glycosyltransferase involved in cell wall biosynthesis
MRSAHLMAGAAQGGAELFFERLVPALAQPGDEVLPIIRRDAGRTARLRQAGLNPVQLPFGGRLDFVTRWRVGRRLRGFAPRVAVAWMGRAARHTPAGPWVLVGRLGGRYDLRQFAHCDHLVGNTPGMARWLCENGWPTQRVHVLPNFSPDFAGAAPAALPVPDGAPVVLAMGRLHRAKGFDVLLAALARLPSVHGVIAGDGPEAGVLRALSRRAGLADRVHFLGWRHDTAALLSACTVFVCPSRTEPLGNVVVEAFSAGRPVVAAAAEGPTWLLEGGARGILVAAESGMALAAGIDAMLANADMARRMAASGRAYYEANFAQAPVVAAWRRFCASVEKP